MKGKFVIFGFNMETKITYWWWDVLRTWSCSRRTLYCRSC